MDDVILLLDLVLYDRGKSIRSIKPYLIRSLSFEIYVVKATDFQCSDQSFSLTVVYMV